MSRCPHCGETHGVENHFCPVSGQPIELGPRLISQKLLERFRVVTILGEGPIGIVLEVEEIETGRRFAAKLIHPQFTRNVDASDKLLEDAKRISTLKCDHLAEVVEVGRDTGAALTVVRELMTGQCLASRIEEIGQLPIAESVSIAREILLGLDALHGADMVILDLSSADVFLAKSKDGIHAKLVDIGERHVKQHLILEADEDLESRSYYAPEQFDKSLDPDPRSDLYAAAAVLYEMLSGQIPSSNPEPISSFRKDVSSELSQVIHRSLSPDPGERYQTAKEFIDALNEAGSKVHPVKAAAATPAPTVEEPPPAETTPAEAAPEEAAETEAAPEEPAPEEPAPEETAETEAAPEEPAPEETAETEAAPAPAPSPPAAADEQASVIVAMSPMETRFPLLYSQRARIAAAVVALLGVVLIIAFSIGGEDAPSAKQDESEAQKTIAITIEVSPRNAVVTVDGSRVKGNPVTLDVVADSKLHTIRAKADGFEPLEKDVKFDVTKSTKLELIEIIQPDEPGPSPQPVVEEIKEIEEIAMPAPEVEMPQGEAKEAAPTPSEAEPVEAAQPPAKKELVVEPKVKKEAVKKPAARKRAARKPAPKKPALRKPAPQKTAPPKQAPRKRPKKKTRDGFNVNNPFG